VIVVTSIVAVTAAPALTRLSETRRVALEREVERLLTLARSHAHADADVARETHADALFALDATIARLAPRLADPDLTITEARADAITLSDGASIARSGDDLIVTAPGLPDAVLATPIARFELAYHDHAGAPVDVAGAFDEAAIARIGVTIETGGRVLTGRLYREGVRRFAANEGLLEWGTIVAGTEWTTVELERTF
jgi:type II secretory pathway pseudopilin PulG